MSASLACRYSRQALLDGAGTFPDVLSPRSLGVELRLQIPATGDLAGATVPTAPDSWLARQGARSAVDEPLHCDRADAALTLLSAGREEHSRTGLSHVTITTADGVLAPTRVYLADLT